MDGEGEMGIFILVCVSYLTKVCLQCNLLQKFMENKLAESQVDK